MTFDVYATTTPPEHMIKDLSTVISPQAGWGGAIRGEISIEEPVVELEAQIDVGNYVKIREWNRYYWIRKKTRIRRDLTELELVTDPLMTAATDIVKLPIIATRASQRAKTLQEAGWNAYLADRDLPIEVPTIQDYYLLHTFTWGDYILVTIG